MIWQAIVLTFCVWYFHLMWKRRKMYYLSMKVKNDEMTSFPFLGHGYIFFGNNEDRMKAFQNLGRIALKNKGLAKLWIGQRFYIVVTEPSYLDPILKSCLDKDDIISIARELFNNGSIFAPLAIWRIRRKVIAPTFSLNNLNQFVSIFSDQSKVMVQKLQREAGHRTFSLWRYLTTYTMDSVCESALGIKVKAQTNLNHPFLNAFESHCEMGTSRLFQPFFIREITKYLPGYKAYMKPINIMTEFIDKIIENKRKEIQETHHNSEVGKIEEVKLDRFITKSTSELSYNMGDDFKKKSNAKSFLELYINSSGGKSGFTNVELREESLVLVLAGTDTSAVGAAFTSLMLAMHPHVQEKVFEEIKIVFGDSDRSITAEDFPRLKYLDMVVKESLRLYPPVPVIVRKLDKDIQLSNGLILYKDTPIVVNIWSTHRNTDYWGSDAEQFRPERFIDSAPEHPAAFIPFSAGPRSCLGYQYAMMSMKTAIANLIRKYKLLPPSSNMKLPLRVKFDIMLKHVDNFEIRLEKRF